MLHSHVNFNITLDKDSSQLKLTFYQKHVGELYLSQIGWIMELDGVIAVRKQRDISEKYIASQKKPNYHLPVKLTPCAYITAQPTRVPFDSRLSSPSIILEVTPQIIEPLQTYLSKRLSNVWVCQIDARLGHRSEKDLKAMKESAIAPSLNQNKVNRRGKALQKCLITLPQIVEEGIREGVIEGGGILRIGHQHNVGDEKIVLFYRVGGLQEQRKKTIKNQLKGDQRKINPSLMRGLQNNSNVLEQLLSSNDPKKISSAADELNIQHNNENLMSEFNLNDISMSSQSSDGTFHPNFYSAFPPIQVYSDFCPAQKNHIAYLQRFLSKCSFCHAVVYPLTSYFEASNISGSERLLVIEKIVQVFYRKIEEAAAAKSIRVIHIQALEGARRRPNRRKLNKTKYQNGEEYSQDYSVDDFDDSAIHPNSSQSQINVPHLHLTLEGRLKSISAFYLDLQDVFTKHLAKVIKVNSIEMCKADEVEKQFEMVAILNRNYYLICGDGHQTSELTRILTTSQHLFTAQALQIDLETLNQLSEERMRFRNHVQSHEYYVQRIQVENGILSVTCDPKTSLVFPDLVADYLKRFKKITKPCDLNEEDYVLFSFMRQPECKKVATQYSVGIKIMNSKLYLTALSDSFPVIVQAISAALYQTKNRTIWIPTVRDVDVQPEILVRNIQASDERCLEARRYCRYYEHGRLRVRLQSFFSLHKNSGEAYCLVGDGPSDQINIQTIFRENNVPRYKQLVKLMDNTPITEYITDSSTIFSSFKFIQVCKSSWTHYELLQKLFTNIVGQNRSISNQNSVIQQNGHESSRQNKKIGVCIMLACNAGTLKSAQKLLYFLLKELSDRLEVEWRKGQQQLLQRQQSSNLVRPQGINAPPTHQIHESYTISLLYTSTESRQFMQQILNKLQFLHLSQLTLAPDALLAIKEMKYYQLAYTFQSGAKIFGREGGQGKNPTSQRPNQLLEPNRLSSVAETKYSSPLLAFIFHYELARRNSNKIVFCLPTQGELTDEEDDMDQQEEIVIDVKLGVGWVREKVREEWTVDWRRRNVRGLSGLDRNNQQSNLSPNTKLARSVFYLSILNLPDSFDPNSPTIPVRYFPQSIIKFIITLIKYFPNSSLLAFHARQNQEQEWEVKSQLYCYQNGQIMEGLKYKTKKNKSSRMSQETGTHAQANSPNQNTINLQESIPNHMTPGILTKANDWPILHFHLEGPIQYKENKIVFGEKTIIENMFDH